MEFGGSIPGGDWKFLFSTASRLALVPTLPPSEYRGLFPGVKHSAREADHSPPSCRGQECVALYLHPNASSLRGA
jgi:hypothetical protein